VIKFYIFLALSLMGLLIYGADWWLSYNDLTWGFMRRLWIFWLFSGLVGFLLGGFLTLLLAEVTLVGERKEIDEEYETRKEKYKERVDDSIQSDRKNLHERESAVLERESLAESRLEQAREIREDAERQILEYEQDTQEAQKSSFNCTNMVIRLKKKIEDLEARG
jgi:phosphate/sulfate permease